MAIYNERNRTLDKNARQTSKQKSTEGGRSIIRPFKRPAAPPGAPPWAAHRRTSERRKRGAEGYLSLSLPLSANGNWAHTVRVGYNRQRPKGFRRRQRNGRGGETRGGKGGPGGSERQRSPSASPPRRRGRCLFVRRPHLAWVLSGRGRGGEGVIYVVLNSTVELSRTGVWGLAWRTGGCHWSRGRFPRFPVARFVSETDGPRTEGALSRGGDIIDVGSLSFPLFVWELGGLYLTAWFQEARARWGWMDGMMLRKIGGGQRPTAIEMGRLSVDCLLVLRVEDVCMCACNGWTTRRDERREDERSASRACKE